MFKFIKKIFIFSAVIFCLTGSVTNIFADNTLPTQINCASDPDLCKKAAASVGSTKKSPQYIYKTFESYDNYSGGSDSMFIVSDGKDSNTEIKGNIYYPVVSGSYATKSYLVLADNIDNIRSDIGTGCDLLHSLNPLNDVEKCFSNHKFASSDLNKSTPPKPYLNGCIVYRKVEPFELLNLQYKQGTDAPQPVATLDQNKNIGTKLRKQNFYIIYFYKEGSLLYPVDQLKGPNGSLVNPNFFTVKSSPTEIKFQDNDSAFALAPTSNQITGNNANICKKSGNSTYSWNIYNAATDSEIIPLEVCESQTYVLETTKSKQSYKCKPCSPQFNSVDLFGNPVSGVNTALGCIPVSLNGVISAIIRIGIGIAGGLAFLRIVYAFIMIITKGDNPETVKNSQSMITSSVIGLLVIILSVFILNLIGIQVLQLNKSGYGGSQIETVTK